MSGLHVVQCLCHGEMFWGRVTQSTGNVTLQPLDPSFLNLGFFQHIPGPLMMPFDTPNARTQAFAATPGNQPPQITGLPTLPMPMSTSGLPQPVLDPLLMTFPPPTPVNPTDIPPPISFCTCGFCRLPEVPQRLYQSAHISMEPGSRIGELITFSKGGCGILLRDAIENRLSGLVGGDDLMFHGFNVSAFSLRITWPGYPLWTGKFRARNWGSIQGQVSRARLAVQIAKRVADSIAAMEGIQCTETGWELGDNGIHIDRLILDSISCVSRGSWQPLLRLLP